MLKALVMLCSAAVHLLATQVPVASQPPAAYLEPRWTNLDEAPSSNDTHHLIFDSIQSLLQHWPNTRYRAGHTIVPGTIPLGTTLFHVRLDPHVPMVPEWTATDPEHSYIFCGMPWVLQNATAAERQSNESEPQGCWMLTFTTIRPLKILYFDGASGAKINDGPLDTQDMLIWGKPSPERTHDERGRLDALCKWGAEFGLDGFVRMAMDFEVMICDFAASLETVGTDYLASWFRDSDAEPTSFARPTPTAPSGDYAVRMLQRVLLQAGSWHARFPGESKIVLDYANLFSFYDPELFPSYQLTAERWDHRAGSVSHSDIPLAIKRLEDTLRYSRQGSGVDWRTLYHGVVERWAGRLETLRYLLESKKDAVLIQQHLRLMLTPFIPNSVHPFNTSTADWAAPIWPTCASRLTAHIYLTPALVQALTSSEITLLRSVDATTREVCRSVIRMWSWGVESGFDAFLSPASPGPFLANLSSQLHDRWLAETHTLMDWLDWSVWVKCLPECGAEEMCYLSTWPYFFSQRGTNPSEEERRAAKWRAPQPRCIRIVHPYEDLSE